MSVFSRGTASRSRMRTVIGGLAIAGVSALVLAGCAGGGETGTTDPSESSAPMEDLTLKIGTVLPQTGSLAFLGPPEEAGVQLAVNRFVLARERLPLVQFGGGIGNRGGGRGVRGGVCDGGGFGLRGRFGGGLGFGHFDFPPCRWNGAPCGA